MPGQGRGTTPAGRRCARWESFRPSNRPAIWKALPLAAPRGIAPAFSATVQTFPTPGATGVWGRPGPASRNAPSAAKPPGRCASACLTVCGCRTIILGPFVIAARIVYAWVHGEGLVRTALRCIRPLPAELVLSLGRRRQGLPLGDRLPGPAEHGDLLHHPGKAGPALGLPAGGRLLPPAHARISC
jgi:hypothetical protein